MFTFAKLITRRVAVGPGGTYGTANAGDAANATRACTEIRPQNDRNLLDFQNLLLKFFFSRRALRLAHSNAVSIGYILVKFRGSTQFLSNSKQFLINIIFGENFD